MNPVEIRTVLNCSSSNIPTRIRISFTLFLISPSGIYSFDYFDALNTIISTDRVVSVHIHDNTSISGSNPHFSDDHGSIGTGNVPINESVSVLVKKSSANLIVEAVSDPMKNLELLNSMV